VSGFDRTFFFRGTFGQTVLLVSAALLFAQGVGFFLVVNERDRWRLLDAVQPAVERFALVAQEVEGAKSSERFETARRFSRPEEHFLVDTASAIDRFHLARENDLEVKLRAALAKEGIKTRAVRASSIGFANSPRQNNWFAPFPMMPGFAPPGSSPQQRPFGPPDHQGPPRERQAIALSIQLSDGSWLNAQFFSMRPSAFFLERLLLAELILFVIVLTVALVLAMRLARPMMRLATAADNLAPGQPPEPVRESGPPDIRAAIRSFNGMTGRISELLREKDRILGALGHDLRTPLASLRIRAEDVESDALREKMIETIDDMKRMVDEILDLARIGYSREEFAFVDLGALADSIVEEFRDLGRDATYVEGPRTVLRMQPLLVRRLLRNLIENGLKFGEQVRVTIERSPGCVSLQVGDDGPGIPDDMLDAVLEPFSRLESSRSRDTGGAGLGLSIAAGIAMMQGAKLVLENAQDGGLIAAVVWPASSVLE
jgi:signal transduction histidine kinase